MKKVFIVFILLYGHVNALERESTLKIFDQIFSAMISAPTIKVYTNDKEYRDVFIYSKKITLSENPQISDIILITDQVQLNRILQKKKLGSIPPKSILFVTDYHFLKKSSDIVGAFYWRKGRSQLLFIKDRLDKHQIVLPKVYEEFLVDEL